MSLFQYTINIHIHASDIMQISTAKLHVFHTRTSFNFHRVHAQPPTQTFMQQMTSIYYAYNANSFPFHIFCALRVHTNTHTSHMCVREKRTRSFFYKRTCQESLFFLVLISYEYKNNKMNAYTFLAFVYKVSEYCAYELLYTVWLGISCSNHTPHKDNNITNRRFGVACAHNVSAKRI